MGRALIPGRRRPQRGIRPVQNFYTHCIFCGSELTENEKQRQGEHIIPECLYGSFCIKDVCIRCNRTLGHTADHRALEDRRIISAAFELDLPELQARIRDRSKGKMVDESGESLAPVVFKNGKPKLVPQPISDKLFTCDERDAPTHLLNRLRKDRRHGLEDEEVEQIVIRELMPRYNQLNPGESVSEPRLGVGMRKAPLGPIHQQWKVTEGAAERLVAKVGYETAFLILDREGLASTCAISDLAAVAMGDGHLSKLVLMYPPNTYSPVNAPPYGARYHHQIIFSLGTLGTKYFIDIYFFGCVGFRLLLRGDSPGTCRPIPHPDGDLEVVSLLMTFEPNLQRMKYVDLRRAGSEAFERYDLTGLL